jgi:hypothetical protein
MRTITCTSLGSVSSITVGSTYEIIAESGSRYTIINDKGVQANYGKLLFSAPVEQPVVVEQPVALPEQRARRGAPRGPRAARAAAAGVIAPAPRLVESIEVNTSASYDDDSTINFSVDFNFGEGFSTRHNTGSIIEYRGINASCGIQSISGINSLSGHVISSRDVFERYVAAHTNDFTLSPGINVDELFAEVSKGLIQDLIASFQGEEAELRAGLIVVSTTEDAFANNPSFRSVLDEVSDASTSVMNPNSRNQIVTWMIPVEA